MCIPSPLSFLVAMLCHCAGTESSEISMGTSALLHTREQCRGCSGHVCKHEGVQREHGSWQGSQEKTDNGVRVEVDQG